MKILDVPIYNADGTIKFTQQISPEEAQALLQFAINFMAATGLANVQLANTQQPEMND